MTENLRLVFAGNYVGQYNRLTNTITPTEKQITPENSHVGSTWLPNYTTQTATDVVWRTSSSISETEVNMVRSYISNGSTLDGDGNTQLDGAYYNWYTATAGSGTYNLNNNANAPYDICPKNFQLESSWNSYYGWRALFLKMFNSAAGTDTDVSTLITRAPISVIFSGMYSPTSGAISSKGSIAFLWERNAYGVSGTPGYEQAYSLYVRTTGSYNPTWGVEKTAGVPVRCAVRGS